MVRTRIIAASFLMLGLLISGRLAAEDKVTDWIPAKTLAVVKIKNPTELVDKTAEFVDALQPGLGAKVKGVSQGMGQLIDNPTLAGVSKENAWWIAFQVSDEKSNTEQPLFIIPLLKGHEDDLPKNLGDRFKYVRKGDWGIYTKNKEIFEQVEKLLKGDGKSITSAIDEPSGKLFSDGDIAVFLNLADLIAQNKAQFDQAREQIAKEMQQASDSQQVPGVNTKSMFQAMSDFLGKMIQAVQDTRTLVVSGKISKQGITLEDLVRFTPDSASDKFTRTVKPAPVTVLTQLPPEHQIYFGAHFDVSKFLTLLSTVLEGTEGQEKSAADFKRLMGELAKVKYGSLAGAVKTGTMKDGVIRVVSVAELDSPEKVRTMLVDFYKTISEFKSGPIKQTFKFERDAEKYGTKSADIMTVTTEVEDKNVAAPIEAMMKLIYGPDGPKTRMIYLKDRVLQSIGGGKEALAAALESQEKAPDATSAVGKARAELPETGNFYVLIDLPNLIRNIGMMVIESGQQIGIPAEAFEKVKLKESYLAGSVGIEPQGIRGRLHIPFDQVQGLTRLALSTEILTRMGFFGH